MKKFSMVHVVLLPVLLTGCNKNSDEAILKVMTFNIRTQNPSDSFNSWPYRASFVCRFLNNEKPDLFGMQEVLARQFDYLDSVMTDYSSVGVGRSDGVKAGEMNPVFFRKERFELIRAKTFWLSETPDIGGIKKHGEPTYRVLLPGLNFQKRIRMNIFISSIHISLTIPILQGS